jgi:hypothetical protein
LPGETRYEVTGFRHLLNSINTECNRMRYTILKIYCDQMNSNNTKQFHTEHTLTFQDFLQVFNMAATGYAADIQTIFQFVPLFAQESDTNQR